MLPTKCHRKPVKGFTLIELLVVITIIGILAAVLIAVINPNRYIARSRNTRRRVDLHQISLALKTYFINTGSYPPDITTTETEICRENAPDCTGYADISVLTVDEQYLPYLPNDPESTSINGSGYTVYMNTFGRIFVNAPMAELGEVISLSK